MTIILSEIINFPLFYNQVKESRLPIRTAYKLSQLKKEIDFHLNFYRENLYSIISEYGVKDEQGQLQKTFSGDGFQIRPEFRDLCSKEIEELLNLRIELPEIYFKLEEFDGIELTVEALECGTIFIKE